MSTIRYNSGQAPKFFDAHTHTQFAAFNDDADAVIKRALDNDVWLINVGTQKDTSDKAIEFAEKYGDGVYATAGLHPIHTEKSYHDPQELGATPRVLVSNSHELENRKEGGFISREEEFDYDYYKKLAVYPKVVAIGECGLDYFRIKNQESRIKQFNAFKAQIELAAEVKKPLMIHCRPSKNDDAYNDLFDILKPRLVDLKPSVIHFFVGSVETARKFLDLGFSFTFGGVITFAGDYDEAIRSIPIEKILLETDAPYVAPVPYRGKRNEPSYVVEVAKKIAEIKNLGIEEISRITTENALKVFDITI